MAEAYYAYWVQRDYALAEGLLARVLARSPEHAEAWLARGFVARRDGRFEDALRALRRALEVDPVNREGLIDLGHTLSVLGHFDESAAILDQATRLGADVGGQWIHYWLLRGDPERAWAAVDGRAQQSWLTYPYRAALATRDPERIALSLSPSLWPEELHSPPGYSEAYALAQAEALLMAGQRELAMVSLRAIEARLQALDAPYPGGWSHNGHYWPCDLPGLLGDLDGVIAAERDYLENAPRDVYASAEVRLALAAALARAGDAERALGHLEAIAELLGPAHYLRFSIDPGLDTIRAHPRYLGLKAAYERSVAEQES